MIRALLLLALAAAPVRRGPVFDPVVVRPGIQAPDAGPVGGAVIRSVTATSPLVATPDGGGGVDISIPGLISDGDGGLFVGQRDGGWSKVCYEGVRCFDAGVIQAVTATSPLVATPDGGGGVDISIPGLISDGDGGLFVGQRDGGWSKVCYEGVRCFDAGVIQAVSATAPLLATPDGGGGVDISIPGLISDGGFSILQSDGGYERILTKAGAVWTSWCPGTSCTDPVYDSFLTWYRPAVDQTGAGYSGIQCAAKTAGIGTDNITVYVSNGSSNIAACVFPCGLTRQAVRLPVGDCAGGLPLALSKDYSYRLYMVADTNCTTPPDTVTCNIQLTTP